MKAFVKKENLSFRTGDKDFRRRNNGRAVIQRGA
jgi:hypothetical protein